MKKVINGIMITMSVLFSILVYTGVISAINVSPVWCFVLVLLLIFSILYACKAFFRGVLSAPLLPFALNFSYGKLASQNVMGLYVLLLIIFLAIWLLKPNADNNLHKPDEDEDVELFLSFSKKENETEFCLMTEYNDGSTYKEKALFTVVFAEVVGEFFRDLKTATFIYNYKDYSLSDNLLSYAKSHNHPYEFGIFEHQKGVSRELLNAFSADRTDDDAGESGFFSCVATEDEIQYPNSSEEFNMLYHRMYRENFVAKADLADCWHNDGRITISNMLFTTDEVIEVFKKICDDKDVKLNVKLEN